jgi:rod shape-determining protein MreC
LIDVRRFSAPVVRAALCWLLLELVAAAQVETTQGSLLGSWLKTSTRPFVSLAVTTADTIVHLFTGLRDVNSLSNEVHELREQLDTSRAQNILLKEQLLTLAEAKRLDLAHSQTFENTTIARCVYRQLSAGRIRINAGLPHGVRTNDAVIAAAGLVGRVLSSDMSGSWIQLITHPAAAVSVTTEDQNLQGLALGNGHSSLLVDFIPHDADLVRGELLVSSGADRTFPRGIPVGRVAFVRESASAFLHVVARPAASLDTLRIVLIVERDASLFPGGSSSSPSP